MSDEVWQHAELSLREWKPSPAHARLLEQHGFTVRWGPAGLPAAFVATYGTHGTYGPVMGLDAQYDALPGLSQKKGMAVHDPLVHHYDAYGPTCGTGHGDAHNCLGAGEEQLVGKAYAVKEGVYDGVDAFLGASGHGGGAPDVTPDMCSIWFFVRGGSPARAKVLCDKIVGCAEVGMPTGLTRRRPAPAAWRPTPPASAGRLPPPCCSPRPARPRHPEPHQGRHRDGGHPRRPPGDAVRRALPGGGRDLPDRAGGTAGRDEAGVQGPYRGRRVGLDDPGRHPAPAVRASGLVAGRRPGVTWPVPRWRPASGSAPPAPASPAPASPR
ncbi:hypothetical protein ACF1CG_11530 [Streptomyces sp. NPDC014773]|uniref:hypothetical protein n=1 Tax=Streptomyces sp. NPDC014773 TaxID=3364908 RepID=UPI00370250F3